MKVAYLGRDSSQEHSGRLCGPQRLGTELEKRMRTHLQTHLLFSGDPAASLPRMILSIRKNKIKVMHAHGSINSGLWLLLLKRFVKSKAILTFTDFKKNVTNNYKILNGLDAVIVMDEFARKKLIDEGVKRDKVHLVPYGVEDSFYNAKQSAVVRKMAKKIILYYGDARMERGFHLILRSLQHIKDDTLVLLCVRNFHEGFSKEGVEKFISRYKNVKLWTVKDYPCSIHDLVKSVDLVLLPFIKNTLEPPLTLLEVSAAGKPLVTFNIGGNREVVSPGSVVLDRKDHLQIAEAVNDFRPGKREQKRIFYNWDETVRKIREIYDK
ncbi:hypothetical protein COV20_03955 [Candidatus Woesearchaeota archaeon CG10_big_fil_rev_8_21_14_0_10_45_16]|nr:MAG: hypothetical protein COV20_03955 [Candidatus Woesearchaeota archaeon CG10_big_fil_rev_8_21_14_0_10_45_16]